MNVVDTLSRGHRALLLWVGVTVALLGLFVVVRLQAPSGVDAHIDEAQDRAVSHAAVVGGAMEIRPDSPDPSFRARPLMTLIQAEVFDDPTVARLRVYGPTGVLLFATDQDVRPGDIQAPTEDPGVAAATSGTPYRSIVDSTFTWSTIGGEPSPTELLQTFEPLHIRDRFASAGAVQVDFFMDDLRGAAISEADGVLTVIAILALMSLTAAVLVYRRPAGDDAEEVVDESAPHEPRAELQLLRAKVKTAQDRQMAAERSLEETRAELAATKDAGRTAAERIDALEAELAAATTATAVAASPDPEIARQLEELRDQLAAAEARAAVAELAAAEARTSAPELAASEAAPAAPVRRRAKATKVADVAPASEASPTASGNGASEASPTASGNGASEASPTASGNGASEDLLHRLEERIAAAEDRARRAEERLDRFAPLSDEATDLRARLAKTAARKKLGPSGSGPDGEA